MSPSTFNYSSLPISSARKDIRLLKLLPNKDNSAPVQCTLFRANLGKKTQYTALSYTWGDAADRLDITIAGAVVSVTRNLATALRNLRETARPVILWVDAVCINQNDNQEKTEQVQMMQTIYASAAKAVVWLGPEEDDSDVAIDFMNYTGNRGLEVGILSKTPIELMRKSWTDTFDEDDVDVIMPLKPAVDEVWMDYPFEACRSLMKRSWWFRIWVLQELVLPPALEFACGSEKIDFAVLTAAVRFQSLLFPISCRRMAQISPLLLADMIEVSYTQRAQQIMVQRELYHNMNPWTHLGRSPPLPRLLMQSIVGQDVNEDITYKVRATDPRDMIYGLLGLAADAAELGIIPDYSRSVQDVYTDVAAALLRHGHTTVLAYSQAPKQLPDLPSWVPDWTSTINKPLDHEDLFTASKETTLSLSIQGSALTLKGHLVDRITSVASPWHPAFQKHAKYSDFAWLDFHRYLAEIADFCAQSDRIDADIYPSNPGLRQLARVCVPSADQLQGEDMGRVSRTSEPIMYMADAEAKIADGLAGEEVNEGLVGGISRVYINRIKALYNRRAFLSKMGYVGLVPDHAEVGDVVVVLYGFNVPFMLRPGGDDGRFRLVGDAYVHGIMDGEFLHTDPDTVDFVLE